MEGWRLVDEEEGPIFEFSEFGDTLSKEIALVQSAQALDIATQLAIAGNDLETLIKVAALWTDMSDRLEIDQEDGGHGKQMPGTQQMKMGFNNG